jgi:hypothetical protein
MEDNNPTYNVDLLISIDDECIAAIHNELTYIDCQPMPNRRSWLHIYNSNSNIICILIAILTFYYQV